MNKYYAIVSKIKCRFGYHELKAIETKEVTGLLFGGKETATKYGCKNCNYIDDGWTITETLTIKK